MDDLEADDIGALGDALGAGRSGCALGATGKAEANGKEIGKALRPDRATIGGVGKVDGLGAGNGADGERAGCDGLGSCEPDDWSAS